ncbi:B12-binding domain-containing radical SAM protein [bacterium]|nr:B12-binding domain-containing radical SAM protein [bacterium]
MSDLLLIQPPNIEGTLFNLPGVEVPMSIMTVSAYLKREGYSTDIVDLTLTKNPRDTLRRVLYGNAPEAVGITSYTSNMEIAGRIAQRVREAWPKARLVLGGFHPSALPEQTIREYPVFDAVVHGEGEETLTELMNAWGRGGSIANILGIGYLDGDEVRLNAPRPLMKDLNALPFPDRDSVPVTRYVPDVGNYHSLPTTGILFSRGCPCPCGFCSKSVFLDTVRYRTPENFCDEIRECQRRYGVNDFRLFDEGPTIRKRNMKVMCEEILRQGLKFTWNCFSRVDVVDEELLELMARAGCYHVIYGVETIVPETQERVKKRIDIERTKEVCRLTRKHGIECKANFILGFPWEGEEEAEMNVKFATQLDADLASFNLFKPMPGSPLYDEMTSKGEIFASSWEDFFVTSDSKIFHSKMDQATQKRVLKNAWLRFYFSPRAIRRRFQRLLRDPEVEAKKIFTGVSVLLANAFR